MKFTTLSLALLAAFTATSALAQSTVEVYGGIATVYLVKSSSNPGSTSRSLDKANEGNSLGFRGQENLGGGMTAYFQYESSFDSDTGIGTLGSRESWVGLKTPYGDLALGRGKSAYTIAAQAPNNFTVEVPFDFSYGTTAYKSTASGTINNNRIANDIRYKNTFGPVEVRADYSIDEQDSVGFGGAKLAASARYRYGDRGSVTVGLLDLKDMALCTTPTTTCTGMAVPGQENKAIVITWKERLFDIASLAIGFQSYIKNMPSIVTGSGTTAKTAAAVETRQQHLIVSGGTNLAPNIGLKFGTERQFDSKVNGVYSGATDPTKTKESNIYAVGLDYSLSKRTQIITEYTQVHSAAVGGAISRTFGTGIFHTF